MTVRRSDGSAVSKATLESVSPVVTEEVRRTIGEDFFLDYDEVGTAPGTFESERRRLFYAGQVVTQKQIDEAFGAAGTLTSISPTSGPSAGGTAVTIKGTNLGGTTGVTIGGAAATNVRVVDAETVTATTPAGTLGAKDVVVADDSGSLTLTGGFTYA